MSKLFSVDDLFNPPTVDRIQKLFSEQLNDPTFFAIAKKFGGGSHIESSPIEFEFVNIDEDELDEATLVIESSISTKVKINNPNDGSTINVEGVCESSEIVDNKLIMYMCWSVV